MSDFMNDYQDNVPVRPDAIPPREDKAELPQDAAPWMAHSLSRIIDLARTIQNHAELGDLNKAETKRIKLWAQEIIRQAELFDMMTIYSS